MFEKMKSWLRGLLQRVFDESTTPAEIMISEPMGSAIDAWAVAYESTGRNNPSLGLAAAVAAELARLVTIEAEVVVSGSPRADFLQAQLTPFLDDLRKNTEFGCALGGIAFKPYVSDGHIVVDAVQGDCFFPTAFDTSRRCSTRWKI